MSAIKSEAPARAGRELQRRYTAADLRVFTGEEASRFVPHGDGDPQTDIVLAWELLYRLEPQLYDRLADAERLHPGVLGWLPRGVDRIAEVGAGSGRLTLELIGRGREVVAVEPARPLRQILRRKLAAADHGSRARVIPGFFDELPLPDDFADLVVACSAFTPASGHGGEAGLAEMERVCRPGGCVAIIWPNNLDWLAARNYRYVSFAGPVSVEFASHEEAVELAGIFFAHAAAEVRLRGRRRVPFEVLGINPPRDLAFKVLPLLSGRGEQIGPPRAWPGVAVHEAVPGHRCGWPWLAPQWFCFPPGGTNLGNSRRRGTGVRESRRGVQARGPR